MNRSEERLLDLTKGGDEIVDVVKKNDAVCSSLKPDQDQREGA